MAGDLANACEPVPKDVKWFVVKCDIIAAVTFDGTDSKLLIKSPLTVCGPTFNKASNKG